MQNFVTLQHIDILKEAKAIIKDISIISLCSVRFDQNNILYFFDDFNNKIFKFDYHKGLICFIDNQLLKRWDMGSFRLSDFLFDKDNVLYLFDYMNNKIIKCSHDGDFLQSYLLSVPYSPERILMNQQGNLFIVAHRVSFESFFRIDIYSLKEERILHNIEVPKSKEHNLIATLDKYGNFFLAHDRAPFEIKKYDSRGGILGQCYPQVCDTEPSLCKDDGLRNEYSLLISDIEYVPRIDSLLVLLEWGEWDGQRTKQRIEIFDNNCKYVEKFSIEASIMYSHIYSDNDNNIIFTSSALAFPYAQIVTGKMG
jgi:hypothetical protein